MPARLNGATTQSAVCAALLALAGCSEADFDFGGPLSPRDFDLGGEHFQIDLPEKAAVSVDPGGAFVWIELAPGTRNSPSIWLESPYDDTQPFAYDLQKRWSGALSLDYRTELSGEEETGSGGPEASLDGRLAFAGRSWSVACALQKEDAVVGDADWCLPLLGSLEAARL